MKYLLDSVILIDHSNGIEVATAFMADTAATAPSPSSPEPKC